MDRKPNRKTEFLKNTIILFVGKFCTQFITFLLIPLYTRYLLTDDYGMVDLFQTYLSLFVPVLTLRIDSAVFRFLVEKRNNENESNIVINNALIILVFNIIISLILGGVFYLIIDIKYYNVLLINIVIQMISSIFIQILRGMGKNIEYTISTIITGIITLILNYVMIVYLEFDASSILIASSIANLICIMYVSFCIKIYKRINIKVIKYSRIKSLLKYSIPMIPNSLSWWIVNVSDRTIISIFLGVTYNAIYTISCKFSNIINSIFSIFNMSWQETASLHINDADKNDFFSDMINKQMILFSSISILIVAILPFIYKLVIGENYQSSYMYIPLLLYANLWSILISLIGGIYIALKLTKEIAITTLVSSVINICINFILINRVGLWAACISTLISYMLISIHRYIDCRKYVILNLNLKNWVIYTLLFSLSSTLYMVNNYFLNLINIIICICYLFFLNHKIIFCMFTRIRIFLVKYIN